MSLKYQNSTPKAEGRHDGKTVSKGIGFNNLEGLILYCRLAWQLGVQQLSSVCLVGRLDTYTLLLYKYCVMDAKTDYGRASYSCAIDDPQGAS